MELVPDDLFHFTNVPHHEREVSRTLWNWIKYLGVLRLESKSRTVVCGNLICGVEARDGEFFDDWNDTRHPFFVICQASVVFISKVLTDTETELETR